MSKITAQRKVKGKRVFVLHGYNDEMKLVLKKKFLLTTYLKK